MIDDYYLLCRELAKQSPCQKRGFGSILVLENKKEYLAYNEPIAPAKHLCSGECVRFKIPSGSDALLGACGHSEELAIWKAINNGESVKGAKLYVAGVNKPDDDPYFKSEPYFYCVRCATLMHYAGLAGVHVWVNTDEQWHYLTADQAYQSSLDFAFKIRTA